MINIGVIGVGYLGQHHARIYWELSKEMKDLKLFAVVDTNLQRAKEIAHKYNCEAFDNHKYILEKVDAVSIVSPTITHYDIATDFLRAHKDILVEKPITSTLEEAEKIVLQAKDSDIVMQVGYLERYNPVISTLIPLIKDPIFFESERLSPFVGRGIDVDVTLDLMIHDIDIVLSLLNEKNHSKTIKNIYATGAKILTNKIDVAKAWVEFDSGVNAIFTASRISNDKSRKMKIYDRDGFFVVDYQNMTLDRFFKRDNKIHHESIIVKKTEPLKEEIKDFLECVRHRKKPLVSIIDGRDSLDIAIKIGEKITYETNG
jgi:predicted dehydrogenase